MKSRSRARTKKSSGECVYTSRLQKGGALLDDMRLLVRSWSNGRPESQRDAVVAANVLGKGSRARAADTYKRAFVPRFIAGSPHAAWRIVRKLEDEAFPVEVLRPVYYWITARNEPLLYDFVCEEMIRKTTQQVVTTDDAAAWIASKLAICGKCWTRTVTQKVARGVLATLRDFGILEGAAKKRVASSYLPVESFSYIAYALYDEGFSGAGLVGHSDWKLFLLAPGSVERLFLEADRSGLLRYHSAGQIIRTDFLAHSFEEMANVIARTPD